MIIRTVDNNIHVVMYNTATTMYRHHMSARRDLL